MTEGPLRHAVANVFFKALPAPLEKASRVLVVVVAAPMLGARLFGTYQFATTVAALVTTAAELGLGTWTTRALARDVERTRAIVAAGLRVRLRMVGPCALAIGLIALLEGPGEGRRAVALLGIAALAGAFVDHLGAILRGLEDFRREAVVNIVRALVTTFSALVGLYALRSVTGLATGLLLGALASAAVGQGIVRARTHAGTSVLPEKRPLVALADLAPLWLASVLSTLYFRCDIILLRLLVGDAELGAYGAAYRVFEALMLLPSTIMAVVFPRLVRRGVSGGAGLERHLTALLGVLGLLAGTWLYVASERLVDLVFGPDFARAAVILRALAFCVPVLFLNFALTCFLFARDRERRYLVIVGAALVLNVATNALAIPRWGGPGAAWATLVSEVVLAAGCLLALATAPRADPARSG